MSKANRIRLAIAKQKRKKGNEIQRLVGRGPIVRNRAQTIPSGKAYNRKKTRSDDE